jgi:hypothetical protein
VRSPWPTWLRSEARTINQTGRSLSRVDHDGHVHHAAARFALSPRTTIPPPPRLDGWMDGRTCRTRRGRGVVRVRARCVSLRRRGVESRAQRAIDDHSAGPGGVYAYSRRRCGCAWLSLEKRGFSGACRDRVWLAAQE